MLLSIYASHWQNYGLHELQRIGKCHQQKTGSLKTSHRVNHLWKSRIIMDLVLNIEELLHLAQSMKMFTRLELLFVSYFSKKSVKSFNQFPGILFWDSLKRTPSCYTLQRLLRYLQRRSSFQDQHLMIYIYFMCDRY